MQTGKLRPKDEPIFNFIYLFIFKLQTASWIAARDAPRQTAEAGSPILVLRCPLVRQAATATPEELAPCLACVLKPSFLNH